MSIWITGWGGPIVVALLGALVTRFKPAWILPLVIVMIPLRLPIMAEAHLSTMLVLGAVAGRADRVARVLREERVLLIATLLLPLWIVLSMAWARQPWFAWGLLGKWLGVALAAWLAATDETADPRVIVLASLVAMVPHAVWAVGERLRLIEPLGSAHVLEMRAVAMRHLVRGKGFFWHPNRLAEFIEQVGLLLGGAGLAGVFPMLCALGVAIGIAGIWATGSTAGMATLGGGTVLLVAWMLVPRAVRRLAPWFAGAALLGAIGIGVWAFVAHEGVGTRWAVYDYAAKLISEHPFVGVGGGNWPLAVAAAPRSVSRFWFQGHAHSLGLQLWVELGIIGVLLGVTFFAAPLWSAAQRLGRVPRPWYGIGVGASFAVLGLLAHNLVHYFLREPSYGLITGLMLGVAISVARRGAPAPP